MVDNSSASTTAPTPALSEAPPLPSSSTEGKEGRLALGIGLLYLLFWQITPRIPDGRIGVVLVTTLLSMCLVLGFTVRTARALCGSRRFWIHLCLSALTALPIPLMVLLVLWFPKWSGITVLGPVVTQYARLLSFIPGLNGLLLIWFAASLGVGVSRLVREMKLLLPMGVVLALVDLYVVFGGGAVTQAQQGNTFADTAMKVLTVPLPTTQAKAGASPMHLAIGFADFLFIALFFACFRRFHIPSRRTFLVMSGVLMAYMLLVILGVGSLPALVPIAIVVIGMNLRQFRYDRSEAFALLYAGIIVVVMLGGLFWFSNLPKK